nr:hypothetical protein CFP56_34916 [Quercus suber]
MRRGTSRSIGNVAYTKDLTSSMATRNTLVSVFYMKGLENIERTHYRKYSPRSLRQGSKTRIACYRQVALYNGHRPQSLLRPKLAKDHEFPQRCSACVSHRLSSSLLCSVGTDNAQFELRQVAVQESGIADWRATCMCQSFSHADAQPWVDFLDGIRLCSSLFRCLSEC